MADRAPAARALVRSAFLNIVKVLARLDEVDAAPSADEMMS